MEAELERVKGIDSHPLHLGPAGPVAQCGGKKRYLKRYPAILPGLGSSSYRPKNPLLAGPEQGLASVLDRRGATKPAPCPRS